MRMTVVSMLPVLFMLWRTLKPSTLSSVSTSRENLQQDTDQWLHISQARAWQIATSIKVPGFEVSSNYPFTFSVVCGLLHGVDFSLLHEGYNIDVLTICVALSFLIQWHKNHWKRETQCKNKRKIRSSRSFRACSCDWNPKHWYVPTTLWRCESKHSVHVNLISRLCSKLRLRGKKIIGERKNSKTN